MNDNHETAAWMGEPLMNVRLKALSALLPVFETPNFSFGDWHGGEDQMPWFSLSDAGKRFVDEVYRMGWVDLDFDWASWKQTTHAQRFAEDPRAIEEATISDLEHLLTTHIRQDRFVEGRLASAFDAGHLVAIVRRADAILLDMNT